MTGENFPVRLRGDAIGTIARVPVEEHMANYRPARALMGKRKKTKPKK